MEIDKSLQPSSTTLDKHLRKIYKKNIAIKRYN